MELQISWDVSSLSALERTVTHWIPFHKNKITWALMVKIPFFLKMWPIFPPKDKEWGLYLLFSLLVCVCFPFLFYFEICHICDTLSSWRQHWNGPHKGTRVPFHSLFHTIVILNLIHCIKELITAKISGSCLKQLQFDKVWDKWVNIGTVDWCYIQV